MCKIDLITSRPNRLRSQDKRGNAIFEQSLSATLSITRSTKTGVFSLWTNIVMYLFVKPQTTTDVIWVQYWIHDKTLSTAWSDENLSSRGKTWLSFNTSPVCQVWMAKRLRRWPQNSRVVSSSPAVDKKNFPFCKSSFRSLQLEEAHANEINHELHLANTLFQIKIR